MNLSQSLDRKHKNKKNVQVCIITVSSAESEQPSALVKERTLRDEEESATAVIRLL